MFSKRSIIVVLAGLNLLLATALVILAEPTSAARAQAGPGGRGYLCATALVGQEFEALYILDLSGRRLYCLGPAQAQTGKLEFFTVRDLKQDFRNEGAAPAPP